MRVRTLSRFRAGLYGWLFTIWLMGLGFPALAAAPQAPRSEPEPFPLLKEERLGTLRIGLGEKEVQAQIPGKLHKGKEEFWAATGDYVQEWKYPDCGLSLNMASAKRGGAKTVMSITIQAPSPLKTKRGMGIGSTLEEVAAAYGPDQDKEIYQKGEIFVAGSIYGGLIFTFRNGRVTRIFLGAGAE